MRPWYYTWNYVIGVLRELQYSFARMLCPLTLGMYQTEQLTDVLQGLKSASKCDRKLFCLVSAK